MEVGEVIDLGDIHVDLVRKDIKHVHLSVYPPDGRVRISAPRHMTPDIIRVYAITRLDWIRRQQRKLLSQERETAREYLNRESHYVWGKRYLLRIVEADSAPTVRLNHSTLELSIRPGSDASRRREALDAWYRDQIRAVVPALLKKWEALLGVKARRVLVQHMKTQWGSCNPVSGNIRLNTDLARKPTDCLEYILVHELLHLIEPTHNARFQSLMDRFMPQWRQLKDELNRLPVRHEEWAY
ncbi:zinc metalloprotease [Burkholderia pseudomallei]|uniref:M48 family metallopeptidase n=1 Tax=Burkholderia pseudomallei TaxID=28450 RepID=UPI000F249EA4|nr:SprT family zinc-dependent metalloprotease [Burkholderia pseudomallei]CAJ2848640.1 zinc metalloprotease [Burkholderia pseudomallei]CAJ2866235.1 zinc metalloprotease [Burkholderia pseudomallei]CAJ4392603.1 zinc metalloprotease [Burkholderia pseudomallei]CAJ7929058.1 zinc metalloprotease [Burkholderia pseudomallei]CAJ8151791.1 zinc metalloprotease [Burkholderia pseudomallei]